MNEEFTFQVVVGVFFGVVLSLVGHLMDLAAETAIIGAWVLVSTLK